MTDQQTYTKDDGTVLLEVRPDWRSAKNGRLMIKLPIVSDYDSVIIPAAELLAMIDATDPDAMRAYLRETAPEAERLDAVPEADSPEDVDEHPEPVITVTPEALAAAEQLGRYVSEIRAAFARGIAR